MDRAKIDAYWRHRSGAFCIGQAWPVAACTVPYLAQMFNVEIPRLDLNPEDLYEMETYQAYQHAAYIIRNSKQSDWYRPGWRN